jgi:hypothetical protein
MCVEGAHARTPMRPLALPLPSVDPSPWRCLPVRRLREVLHVGNLDRALKRSDNSYEGLGLSISLDPAAWESITPLAGPRWVLHATHARPAFVDYHRLSRRRRAALTRIATTLGWLTATAQFEASYFDDELERRVAFLFATRADAEAEYENPAFATITPRTVHVATPTLQALWRLRFTSALGDGMAEEVAHTLVLEGTGLFDGIWWPDDDDPVGLSAPRGALFQSRLAHWTATRAA